MDVIEKFGNRVSSQALKDPEKARRLLLAGYRLQEKKLQFLPDRGLPSSGQYVARVVMKISFSRCRNRRMRRWSAYLCRESW
ncbi:MAG: hypothetical protein ACLR6B_19120 [Blautia sp.]